MPFAFVLPPTKAHTLWENINQYQLVQRNGIFAAQMRDHFPAEKIHIAQAKGDSYCLLPILFMRLLSGYLSRCPLFLFFSFFLYFFAACFSVSCYFHSKQEDALRPHTQYGIKSIDKTWGFQLHTEVGIISQGLVVHYDHRRNCQRCAQFAMFAQLPTIRYLYEDRAPIKVNIMSHLQGSFTYSYIYLCVRVCVCVLLCLFGLEVFGDGLMAPANIPSSTISWKLNFVIRMF